MLIKFIEGIGEKTIDALSSFYEALKFTFICFFHMLNPRSYNPAMRVVLTKQIYFTAIQIIPLFIVMAVFFGSIIITFAVDEFSPFFTALLISLRSGTAINTEIAVMKVNNELNTLNEYKIDLIDYLFLPRIIGGVVSVVSLSILFAFIMLGSGYIITLFYMNMDFHTYKYLLINAIEVKDVLTLLFKSIAFGFAVILIPLYSGLKTLKSYTAIPISVLNGMVKLFIAIFLIEVLSLII